MKTGTSRYSRIDQLN